MTARRWLRLRGPPTPSTLFMPEEATPSFQVDPIQIPRSHRMALHKTYGSSQLQEANRESWARATTLSYRLRAIRSPSSRTDRYGRQTWARTRPKQSCCCTREAIFQSWYGPLTPTP